MTGGRELSVYPDRCRLQIERRTIAGESGETAAAEVNAMLTALRGEDPEFDAIARSTFSRPPYETPSEHQLIGLLERTAAANAIQSARIGMSFWTDAAILGEAGIPSVLFGPGGAGLHSTCEYVRIAEVVKCRDVLAELATLWMDGKR